MGNERTFGADPATYWREGERFGQRKDKMNVSSRTRECGRGPCVCSKQRLHVRRPRSLDAGLRRGPSQVVTRAVSPDMFVEESSSLSTFQDILLFVAAGAGLALGVAIPTFYNTSTDASEERGNNQPCFPCDGTGEMTCRFCLGKGVTTMTLGSGEVKEETCVNCSGKCKIVCTTCNGTGIQPRYLDRRVFADDD